MTLINIAKVITQLDNVSIKEMHIIYYRYKFLGKNLTRELISHKKWKELIVWINFLINNNKKSYSENL